MTDSILNATKKSIGLNPDDPAFDADILMYINAACATLYQLGVGPEEALVVVDKDTEWSSLTDNLRLQALCQTFVQFSVKLAFDPPSTSFGLDSLKRLLDEVTWRIQVMADPPVPTVTPTEEV